MSTAAQTGETTALATPSPIWEKLAAKFELTPRAFQAVIYKQTFANKDGKVPTNEQVLGFLVVMDQYDLNPLTKEIWAMPAGGNFLPVVSVDGWAKIINRHPQFNGMTFDDQVADDRVKAITCSMWRRDREHPTQVTEYMNECKRETPMWKQWPARMLRHKATIQAARLAFGFAGILDQDEVERAIEVNEGPSTARKATTARAADLKQKMQQLERPKADVSEVLVSNNPIDAEYVDGDLGKGTGAAHEGWAPKGKQAANRP